MFTNMKLSDFAIVTSLGLTAACGGGVAAPSSPNEPALAGSTGTAPGAIQTQPPVAGMAASPATAIASAGRSAADSGAAGQMTGLTPASSGGSTASALAGNGAAGTSTTAGTGTADQAGSSALAAGASAGAGAGAGGSSSAPASGAPLVSLKYPTMQEKVTDAPVFRITRPMDLTMLEGPRPVIAWANGGCFRSDFTWQPLFDRWAGAGFVVLALTGSGADDDIGSMLESSTDQEHRQLIDWAVKANETGPYAGVLDLKRIVLAGNSCGGVTALQVASKDQRAAAVFVLSGSSALGSVDKELMGAITVPVGYVTGNPSEDVAAPNAADDYDALKEGIPAMLVQRKTGDHITVSTDEKVLPEDAEIALNWMDLALYGNKQAHDTLTSPNVCEHCTPDTWNFKAKNLEKLVK